MALTQTAQKTSQMAPRLVASVRVFCSPLEGAPTWLYHAVPRVVPAEAPTGMFGRLRLRGTDWATRQWAQVEAAPSGTAKYYVKRIVDRLLEYISDEEVFLRNVPADAQSAVVLYPGSLQRPEVLARLHALAAERETSHRFWYRISCLAMCVSTPVVLLPLVPALPFYWNIFRVWANRKAMLGAERLALLLPPAAALAAAPPSCSRLQACDASECCRVPWAWGTAPAEARTVLVPCERLAPLATANDEAQLVRLLADVERSLVATGMAKHAQDKLRAARRLREKHGQV